MSRYQIYLEPRTVAAIDDLSYALDLSRSQIIRDVLDRVMREYKKILMAARRTRAKKDPLLEMMGCIKAPIDNLSEKGDEFYLHD